MPSKQRWAFGVLLKDREVHPSTQTAMLHTLMLPPIHSQSLFYTETNCVCAGQRPTSSVMPWEASTV